MRTSFRSCVGSKASTWLLTRPTTPTFRLSSIHSLTTLPTRLGFPCPIVMNISHCQCGHTIDYLDTHLLWCPSRNECTTAHNTFHNVITAIALKSGTHVQREVSHLFPRQTQRQVDILITKYGFRVLMDVVIAYPTRTNMVQRTSTMTSLATMMVIQKKT